MPEPPYTIFEIQPEWVLEPEALGSKEKFWYRVKDGEPQWLFKFPQQNTGQHWAEKIAAEVAACLEIVHASVEFATFQGTQGSASESFAGEGRDLYHGNQLLAGFVFGYDPHRSFRQSDHTLSNIFSAIDAAFAEPENAVTMKIGLAGYLVLDALIGNTDRHHENWGILIWQAGEDLEEALAPTFDHASSLGRELADVGQGKSRRRFLDNGKVGDYSEKGRGAIFWNNTDNHGLSPLELVRRASALHPALFKPALERLERIDRECIQRIIERVPDGWMSALAREFAVELMCYNYKELREIRL